MTDENQVKLCLVIKNDDDSKNFPAAQVEYLGKVADATILTPYGFTSRPIPEKSLGLLFNIQGQEQNRIFIPLNGIERKKNLKDGEAVFENQDAGSFLYLDEDGNLNIKIPKDIISDSKNITVNGENAEITLGDLKVTCPVSTFNGALTVTGAVNFGSTLAVTGAFGANGQPPSPAIPLPPNATNLGECILLANAMRQLLITYGFAS